MSLCAQNPDPELRRSETPGEALYRLAAEFHRAGNERGRRSTLEFLVRRYPTSRWAVMAREELSP